MDRVKRYVPEIIAILGIIAIILSGDEIAIQAMIVCILITIILTILLFLLKKFE